jgi:N-acetylmuramoyl-L-alanine amidase
VVTQPPSSVATQPPTTVPPTTAPALPVTPSGGNYINVGSGYVVEVIQANVETFDGKTSDDYSHPTNNYLPEGTVDYCAKELVYNGKTAYVLMRSGHRTYLEKKVYPYETEPITRKTPEVKQYNGTLPDHNEIGFASLTTVGHHSILTLDSLWKAPFYFDTNQTGYANPNGGKDRNYAVTSNNISYVDITFCYATVFSGKVSIPSNHPLFKSAEIIENESDYTLRLHLRKKGGFYGWHAYYNDNDQLCFKFLNPVKAVAATNKYGVDLTGVTVMIDVGHGGIDGGAVAYRCATCKLCWTDKKQLLDKKNCPTCKQAVQMHEEANLNLSLANAIKAELESVGATVIMNRYDDKSININDRLRDMMEKAPDICIAVHQNSYSSANISGFDSFYFTPWSKKIAENIAVYTKDTGVYTKSRFQWSVNYFMMRQTVCPIVLTENGYVSNTNDLTAMVEPEKVTTKAVAIAHGVADYFLAINK